MLSAGLADAQGNPWQLVVQDLRDTVAGTLLALESEAAIGEAFNMTGPPPITYASAAKDAWPMPPADPT